MAENIAQQQSKAAEATMRAANEAHRNHAFQQASAKAATPKEKEVQR